MLPPRPRVRRYVPQAGRPDVVEPNNLVGCHPVVARTGRRLGTSATQSIAAPARNFLTVSVSHSQKDGNRRLLDGTVKAAYLVLAPLVTAKADGLPLNPQVVGQFVTRIDRCLKRQLLQGKARATVEVR